MITEKQLCEASLKTDLFKFISKFIESKNIKNKEVLLESWYSGWGDKVQSWGTKLGNFLGNTKKSFQNARSNFSSAFQNPQSQTQKDSHLKIAKKAYELLKNANLLNDPDLKNGLERTMQKLDAGEHGRDHFEHSLSFKEWLANEAISPKVFRPDLAQSDIKKFEVSLGDIVEMGPETKFEGKKINRIGQVVELRGTGEVVLKDLTKKGNPKIVVPISELHDKEELRGMRIIPREEMELKALGGKRLWVRLTPRQYKKFAGSYRADVPEIIPISKDDGPSAALKRMFAMDKKSEPEETLSIFDEKPKEQPKNNPLGRFIASRRGIF